MNDFAAFRIRNFVFAQLLQASVFAVLSSTESQHREKQLSRCGMNALSPVHMSPTERLAELAEILARGLGRMKARQSRQLSADCGESSVDCSGDRSGHAERPTRRPA